MKAPEYREGSDLLSVKNDHLRFEQNREYLFNVFIRVILSSSFSAIFFG
jgi:hypothetical protein